MKKRMRIVTVLSVFLCIMFAAVSVVADTSATITGEVTEANEIITDDGTAYTIAPTEKGDELAAMVGEIVKVTGTVQEGEGEKTITVTNFSVVQK
jgi:poly(3-hydroxybutyrate) depolymerase